MALDTYANLQAAITKWAWMAGLTEFEETVPDMITLAEERFNNELRVGPMETTAAVTLTSGVGALPADFLEARRLVSSSAPYGALSLVTPDWASDAYPVNHSGPSSYYTVIGSALTTYPSGTGNVALTYYAKIPALSDGNQTNWLLTKYPSIYLYGSLMEAGDFMRDQSELQKFAARYQAAVKNLSDADKMARFSSAQARTSGPTP